MPTKATTKKKPTTAQEKEKAALNPVQYTDQEEKDARAAGFKKAYPMPAKKRGQAETKESDLSTTEMNKLTKLRNKWAQELKNFAEKGKEARLAEVAAKKRLKRAGKKRKKST